MTWNCPRVLGSCKNNKQFKISTSSRNIVFTYSQLYQSERSSRPEVDVGRVWVLILYSIRTSSHFILSWRKKLSIDDYHNTQISVLPYQIMSFEFRFGRSLHHTVACRPAARQRPPLLSNSSANKHVSTARGEYSSVSYTVHVEMF
jgi:hypothetical protein